MNAVIAMLFAFVVLGLFSHRLGKYTYVLMGLAIVAYVAYGYTK